MTEPNFGLMLWAILLMWFVMGICNILAGMGGEKKETHYGGYEIIDGLFYLSLAIYVCVM